MREFFNKYPDISILISMGACLVMLCSVLLILNCRRKMIKTFDRLNQMLDNAINGSFEESVFDESKLSALESRFADYMAASRLSAQNIEKERNKIKELITDISHQTKTPISNIILYSELLLETVQDSKAREDITALHQQAQKLSFLIASLVKLSRLETGIIAVRPEPRNAVNLIEQLQSQYQPAANQKGLYLNVAQCDMPERAVPAKYDEKWTLEAIGNIVDNAVKYTEKGGVTIALRVYELFCCIEIADTGVGIAEEETAKIFRRFYRSQASSQVPGIGVGLYLAREIISAENGYIKAVSRMGEGTRFYVYLPR